MPTATPYQLINIHQRTKTIVVEHSSPLWYQLINIHQRTKTFDFQADKSF